MNRFLLALSAFCVPTLLLATGAWAGPRHGWHDAACPTEEEGARGPLPLDANGDGRVTNFERIEHARLERFLRLHGTPESR